MASPCPVGAWRAGPADIKTLGHSHVLTNRPLRTAAPMAMMALALTACGPQGDGSAASEKGPCAAPLALKTPADVSETHFAATPGPG